MTTLAILSLSGCDIAIPATAQSTPPEVEVVTVEQASVPVTVELPGRTSAYLVAQVRARVDGIVQKRSFQEGADVKADQVLYQIDPAPYRAALNSAEAIQQKMEANLAMTTAQAERYKILISGKAISQQAYDNAVSEQLQAAADVAAAKAAVATAKINLGYTTVVSPIAGRSSTSQATQGAYVQGSAATLLTTVQQIDPIYVDLNQSSVAGLLLRRDVASGQVKLNDADRSKITLMLEDGTEYPLAGTLQYSGVMVDPGTGSVTVRAIFPNPKHVLLPGMFVRGRIEKGVNEKAFLVPVPAVTRNAEGQATTLVVDADNKVVQRPIQTQSIIDNQWVVTGGLSQGERVIVAGRQKVQAGMLVQAIKAQNPTMPVAVNMAATDHSATHTKTSALAQVTAPSK